MSVKIFPLVVVAGTVDSTLCGWKIFASTQRANSAEERLLQIKALKGQVFRKQETQEEEEEEAQEDDQVTAFLRAVEEEQRKLKEGKISGVEDEEDVKKLQKEEELFQFLRAIEQQQRKELSETRLIAQNSKATSQAEEAIRSMKDGTAEQDEDEQFLKHMRALQTGGDEQKTVEADRLYPYFAMKPHVGSINSVASFGKFVASGGYDENICLFDLKRNKKTAVVHTLMGSVSVMSFIGLGSHFAVGTTTGNLSVYKFSNNLYCLWSTVAHKSAVTGISEHPSHRALLTTGADRKLCLWNLINGTLTCSIQLEYSAVDVKWSPLGDTFSIAVGNDVCVYYAETMEKLLTLKHEKRVTCIEYLSNMLLATGGEDGAVTVFDISTGECLHRLEIHKKRVKSIASLEINAEESITASVCSDGGLAIWRISPDFALLEAFSSVGARFTSVCITALDKVTKFVRDMNHKRSLEQIKKQGELDENEEVDEDESVENPSKKMRPSLHDEDNVELEQPFVEKEQPAPKPSAQGNIVHPEEEPIIPVLEKTKIEKKEQIEPIEPKQTEPKQIPTKLPVAQEQQKQKQPANQQTKKQQPHKKKPLPKQPAEQSKQPVSKVSQAPTKPQVTNKPDSTPSRTKPTVAKPIAKPTVAPPAKPKPARLQSQKQTAKGGTAKPK